MTTLSLYLHIPFCERRCAYCDFNTYAGLQSLMPAYTRALASELRMVAAAGRADGMQEVERRVHSVYFGGGTPSLLPSTLLSEIVHAMRNSFALGDDVEMTIEANPGTVDSSSLHGLRRLGFNRLSLGVQSSHPDELRILDRGHSFAEAATAVRAARRAGFANLNLDLIYGLPHQTLHRWQETLRRTLDLAPDHLSLYALSLEFGTPLRAWVQRGIVPAPDDDLAADMYDSAIGHLKDAGFIHYEISNWARRTAADAPAGTISSPALACRHNLQYWRNLPYLGFGAGAHGCEAGWRYSNVRSPCEFIRRIETGTQGRYPFSPALVEREPLDLNDQMDETLMLGFRLLREGVREDEFENRYGRTIASRFRDRLDRLQELGLITRSIHGPRLAPRGRLLANQVFREFV